MLNKRLRNLSLCWTCAKETFAYAENMLRGQNDTYQLQILKKSGSRLPR